MDYAKAKQLFEALERERVRYVVFGAVALNFHGLPRSTEDLDLFIAPERDNVGRLKRALRSVFDDPHIDEITADDLLGEYPAIQYFPPEQTFHVDLLSRLGEAIAFDDLEISRVPFEGLTISVAKSEDALSNEERHWHRGRVPIRKFRTVEEMSQPIWREPGDPELYRAIKAVWEFGQSTSGKRFQPGVRRFRSIEEMSAQTLR